MAKLLLLPIINNSTHPAHIPDNVIAYILLIINFCSRNVLPFRHIKEKIAFFNVSEIILLPKRSKLTNFQFLEMDLSIKNITVSDLECIVCSQCFMSPITTTCGHTFCRECLARVFDHGLACPLCMTSLKISEQFRGETIILTQALQTHLHKKQWERLTNSLSAIDVLNCRNEVFKVENKRLSIS